VERGAVSLGAAAEVAALDPEEQADVVARGPGAVKEVAAEIRKGAHLAQSTGDNEWYTPAEYVESAREALGTIDLDPASNEAAQEVVKAARYHTAATDGLKQPWSGRVWLNPPYAQPLISDFVNKLIAEYEAGKVRAAVLLTNSSTDTAWFHAAARASDAICFTKGRIRFWKPSGDLGQPLQGQAFFYFGRDRAQFNSAFAQHGFVAGAL
jgi:ParB family chromosome partitioning protein